MRFILIICFISISTTLYAQSDFVSLDKQTYEFYLKGDYKNLEKTGNQMLSQGIDYYYLRMRMGILSFNHQRYSKAVKHFSKALVFSSLDTLSLEYIYNSFLLSGRNSDANLYLESIPWDNKSLYLKSIKTSGLSELYVGSSTFGYDQTLYTTNALMYESIAKSNNIYAGLEYVFSSKLKGNFSYANYQKTGTSYSSASPLGRPLDFMQNQFYGKLTRVAFSGWEFSAFGHAALFSQPRPQGAMGNRRLVSNLKTEYLAGFGVAKSGWKVRSGVDFSYSNFGKSTQLRGEGYLTYLPFGNLNLYFTSSGMVQTDKSWGSTYQVNQEVGFRVFKFLWMESGIASGNAFLFARDQGLLFNNSFQVPSTTIYGNLIFLMGKHINFTVSPVFNQNQFYSWNLNTYTRSDKQELNSYGCSIKLTYKFK
jgi:hypothetical protein